MRARQSDTVRVRGEIPVGERSYQRSATRVSFHAISERSEPGVATQTRPTDDSRDLELLGQLARARRALVEQIGRRIIGQHKIVDDLVAALLAGGHALLVGVPGLAKTLLVQTVSQALELSFSRVQFTPDLMPSDITGTEILEEDHATGRRFFKFVQGPVSGTVVRPAEIILAPRRTKP